MAARMIGPVLDNRLCLSHRQGMPIHAAGVVSAGYRECSAVLRVRERKACSRQP
jgi:hypothetical protein